MPLNTLGSNRDQLAGLAIADRETLITRNVLVGDSRRWRPRWFDGRFLAASDLRAEQNYFLVRQAELGRAGGSGVVSGLTISETLQPETGAELLRIEGGFGFTDTGELVVLFDPLEVNPANVPEMQRLDGAFGLQVIPTPPGIARTGLFVVALRPVEWSANPIGAYPTSLTGTRTVEDGTIVEGVAVSLIPYPDAANDETWNRRRARVAREIFVHGRDYGIDSGVLPLAMVALRSNLVEWVDNFMVRRETGAERPAGMDFGFGARALREAHLLQYQQHLATALTATSSAPFAASAWFDALPAIGQFPAATLDPDRLTQRFFPPGIEVELAFVPEDEVPALIEESLLLPPIDLTLKAADLAGTGVIVLVPLTRADFNNRRQVLPNWDESLPRLQPAFRELQATATPLELLISRVRRPILQDPPPAEPAWQQLLRDAINPAGGNGRSIFWYVRRRYLPIPVNVTPTAADASSGELIDRSRLSDLIRSNPTIATSFNQLRGLNSPAVNSLLAGLAERRVLDDPVVVQNLLTNAVSASTPSVGGPINAAAAVAALSPIANPQFGAGTRRLRLADPDLSHRLGAVATSDLVEIEELARQVPPDRFAQFAKELKKAVPKSAGRPGSRSAQLSEKIAELRTTFTAPSP